MNNLEIILRFKNILLSYISFNHIPDIVIVFRVINSSYYVLNFDTDIVSIFTKKQMCNFNEISDVNCCPILQQITDFYNSLFSGKLTDKSLEYLNKKMGFQITEMNHILSKTDKFFRRIVNNIESNEEKYLTLGNTITGEIKKNVINVLGKDKSSLYFVPYDKVKNDLYSIIQDPYLQETLPVLTKTNIRSSSYKRTYFKRKKTFNNKSIHSLIGKYKHNNQKKNLLFIKVVSFEHK